MSACLRNLLLFCVLAVLGGLAVAGEVGGAAGAPEVDCGIAAWTGTCACSVAGHGAPVSLRDLERSLGGSGAAASLDLARRECRTPARL